LLGQGRARRIGDPGLLPRVLLPPRVDCIESILEGRREDQNVAALRLCRRLWRGRTPNAAVDDLKLTAGKDAYAVVKASDVMIGVD
jgi:hypothetical protein